MTGEAAAEPPTEAPAGGAAQAPAAGAAQTPPADPAEGTNHASGPTLELTARLMSASNATFVGSYSTPGTEPVEVVYKPSRGEKPLWDFPGNDLANREVAAYLVSEALGWNIVPRTWLGGGQFGPGMLQLWQDTDDDQTAVDLVDLAEVPDSGWRTVLTGEDETGRQVVLVHEDSPALRRMAIFDAIINNADRKGGHVLPMADRHRFGVDHGVSFHVEPKLRTVLWGWLGEPFTADELASIRNLSTSLDGPLGAELGDLLTPEEVAQLGARIKRLTDEAVFPAPEGDMPAAPWPLF